MAKALNVGVVGIVARRTQHHQIAPVSALAQPATLHARIKVDTDENGVVWLSGKAPTQDAVDLAGMIAKNTDGVASVHNDVVVQP